MLKTATNSINASQIQTPITLPGNVTLSTGNLVIGTSGKGIDFSITSHPAGMTSELLADYEEGTWTPSIPTGSPTYTDRYGRYTKVGNLITVHGWIQVATISSPSGFTLISGLPFTSENVGNMYNKLTTAWNSFNIGKSIMVLQVRPNSTDIQAVGCTDNQAFADVNASGYSNGTWLSFTGQYFTA